jgi:hypothetical protein
VGHRPLAENRIMIFSARKFNTLKSVHLIGRRVTEKIEIIGRNCDLGTHESTKRILREYIRL